MMTKRDPKDSVHEEQFNAEEKAIESTEETLIEMAYTCYSNSC